MSGRESVLWLHECGFRHAPAAACPPGRVWLVAASCPACWADGRYQHYCPKHDSMWVFEERRPPE